MFRFLIFLLFVFGLYIVFYGTPPVAGLDASLSPGFQQTMANLHASAWASIDQGLGQLKVGVSNMVENLASSFHR